MQLNSNIMLITYADSLGGNLRELHRLLEAHCAGAVGGIHVLPPYPYSADRGFSPITYDSILPKYGTWEDLAALGRAYYLMLDFMINHISAQSPQYQDFLENRDASPYRDMFIRYRDFWPNGAPTQAQVDAIYKRKQRAPSVTATFADGSSEEVWCTFGDDQIDLNLNAPVTKQYVNETLTALMNHGMSLLRLDAFAYCVKKVGSRCFFEEPEIWALLSQINLLVSNRQCAMLPEIHEHYTLQLKLAAQGYWTYDFALPMLTLHALFTGEGKPIKHWLAICPRKQFTTLDTHDGIGVVDAKDLLTDAQLEQTVECLYRQGGNANRVYSSADYHNLDLYQINCTYYAAVGCDDDAYLLARAIQFFAPGIPQVYYVGMLAGENDIALVEATRNGRDINRHNYTAREVDEAFARPVVKKLCELMRLRNASIAFEGDCVVEETQDPVLRIRRSHAGETLVLNANLKTHHFSVEQKTQSGSRIVFAR